MRSLIKTLKSLFTTPRPNVNRQPRLFIDSATYNPKTSRDAGSTAILTTCNEADSIYDRVRAALDKYSNVIVIDQSSTDGTPYFAGEAGAVIVLQEANMTDTQAMNEAARLARCSAANVHILA